MSEQVQSKPLKMGIKRKYDTSSNKSSYASKSLPYDKKNISHNSQSQVSNFRRMYKEVSPDTQMIVDQIIDPEMQNNVTRIPLYGVSSTYTAHNIIQCAYDSIGRSCVAVNPQLTDAIFATSGATFDQVIGAVGTGNNPYSRQSLNISSGQTQYYTNPIFFANANAVLPFPNAATGKLLYPIGQVSVGQATNFIGFQISDYGIGSRVTVRTSIYDASFALLFQSAFIGNSGSGGGQINLFPAGITTGAYMAIEIRAGNIAFEGNVDIYFYDTAVPFTMRLANHVQHCLIYSINGATDILNSAERFVVTSQSVKLTYQGSSLQDGGQLAMARLPANSVVGEKSGLSTANNWYSFIANLSRNSYNGPVKEGGYTFWLGEDERNYFYRSVDSLSLIGNPYIVGEWTSEGSPTQAIRIMVTTIIQFTTNNNIYDQKPSPYIGEDWCKLLHLLSCINSSYDNPGHRAKLTAALKKVGSKILMLLKDPKTYATLGSIAAALI